MALSLTLQRSVPGQDSMRLLISTALFIWHRARARLMHPYRPERHYMRGPGPKCREKQIVTLVRQARSRRGHS